MGPKGSGTGRSVQKNASVSQDTACHSSTPLTGGTPCHFLLTCDLFALPGCQHCGGLGCFAVEVPHYNNRDAEALGPGGLGSYCYSAASRWGDLSFLLYKTGIANVSRHKASMRSL